jgi:hypothetical protein
MGEIENLLLSSLMVQFWFDFFHSVHTPLHSGLIFSVQVKMTWSMHSVTSLLHKYYPRLLVYSSDKHSILRETYSQSAISLPIAELQAELF